MQRALITHAHSDHARAGSSAYIAHRISVPVLAQRLGVAASHVQGVEYGQEISVGGVRFSFHPAGHIPGSAQVLVQTKNARWVFSGDYKLEDDGISTPFEPISCDIFISECTFGLPIFSWRPQQEVFEEIHAWWAANRTHGVTSVLCAYSLGKAQRLLAHLDRSIGPVCVHPSIARTCEALQFSLDGIAHDQRTAAAYESPLLIVPPAAVDSRWLEQFRPRQIAGVSGWMAIRGIKRRRGFDRGFVISDHADFNGLARAVSLTGAEEVYLTHGYTASFARWLRETRAELKVQELHANYSDEPHESLAETSHSKN